MNQAKGERIRKESKEQETKEDGKSAEDGVLLRLRGISDGIFFYNSFIYDFD